MDPITLLFLAVVVFGTRGAVRSVREAVRGTRARSAVRADRFEARRRPPRDVRTGRATAATGSARRPRTAGAPATSGRTRRTPTTDAPRHLHAPHRAARFGSRLAARAFTYPALAWMLPAALFRGGRHGRLVGKHWRRNGGDLEDAKRRAAGHAGARGWHIPDWAVPGRDAPAGQGSPDPAPPDSATPAEANPAADTTEPSEPHSPPADAPPQPPRPTTTAVADDVVDADVVEPADLNTLRRIIAANGTTTTNPRTPPATKGTTMSDLTPTPAALFENGDYASLNALGTHGQHFGEQLQEHIAEIGQLLANYEHAAENAVAEAASMRVDAATQSDIAEFQATLSEAKAALTRMGTLSEAVAETATTMKQNLASRHGAIHDAVQDSPVQHAADGSFYSEPAA